MANSKSIGNTYEREFSYSLSEWITGEKDTSICWRDKSSGSRHTVRNRSGRQTSGSGGDIYPTDSRYEYWFAKFYIDTKSYQDINWVFGNPSNQKTNEILGQWIKTISQCSPDKLPMMPCKIRNRTTPELIIFPGETKLNYRNISVFDITLSADIKVAISKKDYLLLHKGRFLNFKTIQTAEFFELNTHQEFYEQNKGYRHSHPSQAVQKRLF